MPTPKEDQWYTLKIKVNTADVPPYIFYKIKSPNGWPFNSQNKRYRIQVKNKRLQQNIEAVNQFEGHIFQGKKNIEFYASFRVKIKKETHISINVIYGVNLQQVKHKYNGSSVIKPEATMCGHQIWTL